MNTVPPGGFASRWADAWNRRAVDEILEHFHDDVVFTSPTALGVVGTPVVRGKDALRAYWNKAMSGIESLRFTVHRALWDASFNEMADALEKADWDGFAAEKQKVRTALKGWPEEWRR